MNENNGLLSSEINISMDKIKTLVELTIGIGTILSVIFSFSFYVIRKLYFCRWGIDITFYSEDNIIYQLIYFFGCACFLIFILLFLDKVINSTKLSEHEKDKRMLKGFMFYLLFSCLLNSTQFFEQGFTLYNTVLYFIFSTVIFIVMAKQTKNNFFKKKIISLINYLRSKNIDIKIDRYNKFLDILSIIIAVLLSIIAIGMIQTFFKMDYRIIETNQPNECSVVLYSTKDYFIVSECEIDKEKNELFIYKDKVKKIDNEEVITNKRIFYKVREKK